jgi:hypothetical protein
MARKFIVHGRTVEKTADSKTVIYGRTFESAGSTPPSGPTPKPPKLHGIDNQFATIIAHRLGGVLEQ